MNHLTAKQRVQLEALVKSSHTHTQIEMADILGCSQATISRELRRARASGGRTWYTATTAQQRADGRRTQSYEQRERWHDNPRVLRYIVEELRERKSPEQIAGRMKRKSPWHRANAVSAKSIYNYIWKIQEEGGCLHLHLRRRGKRTKWFGMSKTNRGTIPGRRDIDERPKIVEKRTQLGHWESDLVVSGRNGSGAVATFVERVSKYVQALLVDQTADSFNAAATTIFQDVPQQLRRTLTHDNGREIAKHAEITTTLNMVVYCAHPYSSWQRGTNENTNGLLRDFFPKGTDFSQVSAEELATVVDLLNNRPRQSLNFLTPEEVFRMEIKDYAFHGSE